MNTEKKEPKEFVVRVCNGFNFEYHGTITAASVQAARKEFLRLNAGAWYAQPHMVKVSSK